MRLAELRSGRMPEGKRWWSTVERDELGEYVIIIPNEVLERVGLKVGDEVRVDLADGGTTITIQKVHHDRPTVC